MKNYLLFLLVNLVTFQAFGTDYFTIKKFLIENINTMMEERFNDEKMCDLLSTKETYDKAGQILRVAVYSKINKTFENFYIDLSVEENACLERSIEDTVEFFLRDKRKR